jgi:hypothetical protein
MDPVLESISKLMVGNLTSFQQSDPSQNNEQE